MQRTKAPTKSLTEEQKWLATMEHIARIIPGGDDLTDEFSQLWVNGYMDCTEDIKPIQHAIRRYVTEWIMYMSANEIKNMVRQLNPYARKHLVEIMPIKYRGYFEYEGGQFPVELCCPIPFLPIEKRYSTNYQIMKPVKKQFGKITLEIRGILCTPDAGKTWVALNQIRKRSQPEINNQIIHYRTTLAEIGRELGKQNPHAVDVQEAIIHHLEQLRGISITWRHGKRFYIGGLLHSATNWEEDETRNINIYQDRFFIESMLNQFVGLRDVETYYSLRGKASNFYLFLNNFRSFRQHNTFDAERWHLRFTNVYDLAGLKSPISEPSEKEILCDLGDILSEFEDRGIIRNSSFTDHGYLIIK